MSAPAGEPVVVVKVSGKTLADEAGHAALWDALAELARRVRLVVAHGGGPLLAQRLDRAGLPWSMIDGLRATPAESIDEVVATLAGLANTRAVAALTARGARAVGVRCTDGGLCVVEPLAAAFGRAACAVAGNARPALALLDAGACLVCSSVGVDASGGLWNVNADAAACAVAEALRAEALWLLSDTPGLLDAQGSAVEDLDRVQAQALLASGAVGAGALPKLRSCAQLAARSSCAVRIAHWRDAAAARFRRPPSFPCTRVHADAFAALCAASQETSP